MVDQSSHKQGQKQKIRSNLESVQLSTGLAHNKVGHNLVLTFLEQEHLSAPNSIHSL
jgi:hypothetical protein